MPLPLVLLTLPPLLNAHRGSIPSCPWAPLFPFAPCLPAGCPVACCRAPLPCITFVEQPPHASILDPPLCSRQLVVASHIIALPPPLDAPPPHNGCVIVVDVNVHRHPHRRRILSRNRHCCRLRRLSCRRKRDSDAYLEVHVCAFAR
jgi:hypothetical protein